MRQHALAVLATVSADHRPEAALMGIAVTEDLEIIFDTLKTTRKYPNLQTNPHVAFVLGLDSEITLQYEGEAQELTGTALEQSLETYFAVFPDGRERQQWHDIVYFKVTPKWLRYSDYNPSSQQVIEMNF